MEKVLQEYAAADPDFPLWAKPNAGLPHLVEGVTMFDVTPEQMAGFAVHYVRLGARVVGGCCGNMPEHIAAIARAVRE
jgi:methionine synthase I (cobalamin-dependent)